MKYVMIYYVDKYLKNYYRQNQKRMFMILHAFVDVAASYLCYSANEGAVFSFRRWLCFYIAISFRFRCGTDREIER